MADTTCRLCGGVDLLPVLRVEGAPVLANVLYDDAASARSSPVGDIELVVCSSCGVLRNIAFDPSVVAYSPDYENSLHFSGTFRSFAGELATRLASTYALAGKTVLEIGSGKGEFLTVLCETAGCTGIGYDPSFEPGATEDRPERVRFVRAHHPTSAAELTADFVCSRHVLEHLDQPRDLLTSLREAAHDRRDVVSYHEVPNGGWIVDRAAVWDLIYEHPWYYTEPALVRLVTSTGHEVLSVRTDFDDQFLSVECRPASCRSRPSPAEGQLASVAAVVDAAARLGARHRSLVDHWQDAVRRLRVAGRRVAVWGIGSKGVSFLTQIVGDDPHVLAVDVNPRKHGRFVPTTAHEVLAPDAAAAGGIDTVLVMNPVYAAEIEGQLASLGITADVVGVQ